MIPLIRQDDISIEDQQKINILRSQLDKKKIKEDIFKGIKSKRTIKSKMQLS